MTEYLTHKAKYRAARAEYKKDAESNTACPKDIKVSADLQKVIMLPKIDEFETYMHSLIALSPLTKDQRARYEVKEIHLKYFEPGHTFMASDATHGRIEKQLRKMGKVFDFRDFVDATKQAKCEPVEMAFTGFNDWESGVSQDALKQLGEKLPYKNQIASARFCSGSEDISYQLTFGESETTVKILKSSFQLAECRCEKRRKPRGLDPTKKAEIIQKLLTLMPENRHSFWKNIAEDKKAPDLATNF
ncbi:hypothetical protein PoB_006594800 [Plakobranchus ocellatus]|uniref:Uncharacterized protein n=1 Tax=Plakobranchus ocellatus TaxID=259542 RepID=A0AAV4D5W8_9GAST|nr:hypothetical protein PoB_006594800 [Plakobranchus ocellatus]